MAVPRAVAHSILSRKFTKMRAAHNMHGPAFRLSPASIIIIIYCGSIGDALRLTCVGNGFMTFGRSFSFRQLLYANQVLFARRPPR